MLDVAVCSFWRLMNDRGRLRIELVRLALVTGELGNCNICALVIPDFES
jgi:hypothetical protein